VCWRSCGGTSFRAPVPGEDIKTDIPARDPDFSVLLIAALAFSLTVTGLSPRHADAFLATAIRQIDLPVIDLHWDASQGGDAVH